MAAEQVVKDIRRKTRRHFSAEDKIRIVLEGSVIIKRRERIKRQTLDQRRLVHRKLAA